MQIHELKTWPQFYQAIIDGEKNFDLRKDDRGYRVGDHLRLKEWHPVDMDYSGRETIRRITYILGHQPGAGCAAEFGLKEGYVILALATAE